LKGFETKILMLVLTNDDQTIVIIKSLWDLMSEETLFTEGGEKDQARREREITL
jgi:hypothetical protein